MSDPQLPPLQLGQALTMLTSCVRNLSHQVGDLRTELGELKAKIDTLTGRVEIDRDGLREFARDVKTALREAATSKSQEMRAARIDTPLPPALPKHGRTRP
jgi:predicted  nucleic acid-binding Zn-ribbon protein